MHRNTLCRVGLELVVLEKKFCWCIFAIALLSPLKKGRGPLFKQTSFYFTQGYFSHVWRNWPCGSEEDFKILSIHFSLFCYHLPLEKCEVRTNLNTLNPSAKVGWNWPNGSEKDRRRRRQQRRRWTTDKLGSENVTWAFGSGDLNRKNWTQKARIELRTIAKLLHHITTEPLCLFNCNTVIIKYKEK